MARDERSLVKNAGDRDQVRRAARIESDRDNAFLACLQVVLATAEGRLVFWHLLRLAGIYRSIWDPSAKIHYNAGQQDFGHMLLAKVLEADERGYELMEREGRDRQRKELDGAAATQQRAAERQGE